MKLKVTKRKFGPEPTRKYQEWTKGNMRKSTLERFNQERRFGETLDDTLNRIYKEWKAEK